MNKTIRTIGALVLLVLWGALAITAWCSPAKESSETERRLLAQFPEVRADAVLSGRFMTAFDRYANDQFPARDSFRSIKALASRYVFLQQDTNDIYLSDGYLAKQEYPLQSQEVTTATGRLNKVYETYLKGTDSRIFCAVVPDKNYYLAENSGHLQMDYDAMLTRAESDMPWAEHIDLTGYLEKDSYYRTDTHWRQETLLPAAQALCAALDMPVPTREEFTVKALDAPFYGVYHGQAALPVAPETLYVMESRRLEGCQVAIHDGQSFAPVSYEGVYDLQKADGRDPYEVFLSGPQSLVQIQNPQASTDRELIIFRDSFGAAIAPLLVSEYKTVTLVDIRYLDSARLKFFLDFHGQDVLFLYSTLVLNSGSSLT